LAGIPAITKTMQTHCASRNRFWQKRSGARWRPGGTLAPVGNPALMVDILYGVIANLCGSRYEKLRPVELRTPIFAKSANPPVGGFRPERNLNP
jgi:hypothetical protein